MNIAENVIREGLDWFSQFSEITRFKTKKPSLFFGAAHNQNGE